MAMMMAGRVLLVCALCVLWCGAGGRCEEEGTAVPESGGKLLTHTHNGGNDGLRLKADFGLISTRMGLIKAVAAGDDGGDGAGNDSLENEDKSPQGGVLAGTKDNEAPGAGGGNGAAGAVNGQLPAAGQKGIENKNVDPGRNAATDSQDQNNDHLSSSSGSTPSRSGEKPSSTGTSEMTQLPKDTVTKLDADLQDKRESSEGIKAEETEEEERQKIKAHTGSRESKNNGGETTPPLPTSSDEESPISDQENSQNSKKVKNEATLSESKTASEAPAPPSKDATQGQHSHDTDTEDPTKNAATGSPVEPTTSSTSKSGSGDHVQNKVDEDDAQSSEEQHDGIETGNTNVVPTLSERASQTPETATDARTNDTTTPGDSDGSTAVSHTTSPFLLFVTCAAAAAVVAA
ncbi:Mucin-associated surface protein (MASP) [Trypanosoma cruzi]|uniref:Mucin-associated surface protein (MASP), putative n=2 Tax=Trypanosoma cruzi TaxID=5693 RepID=Q4E468_TRYCC|nr:mucin-associated surface protein (MASP), putative [Trypanosoma cruzi]EAN99555.1 mucin-associated surface protein (MASP), putative [Trypanosoma cruzi]PWV21264.1 Mucin-associated surface protein (MASP) [Trypanosoma cruzi]|eukprot:XP_821406.1 mucin-associated surface protein (MASP) [Trypanosoma cruzi strain CL Brener]